MLFAAMVDTALLPFFAFSSYLSYLDWSQNRYGWSTLFNDSKTSYNIIFIFFILSCVMAGILFISLIMDIYLATIFRKIAKMPPDMNPLEPNLTSRHGQKHKRDKSSLNVTAKHMSQSTLATQRDSAMSARRIPYIHTRTDSADSVTLYGNESARNSRIEMRKGLDETKMDPYQLTNNSRVTLAPTRPSSAMSPAENARTAGAGLDHRPARSSALANSRSPDRSPERPSSWLSYMDYEGVPTPMSDTASEQLDQEVRPLSPVSALSSRGPSMDQPRQIQERENWYHGSARNSNANLHAPTNASTLNLNANNHLAPAQYGDFKKRSREPLGMNPPTPTTTQQQYQDENVYTPAHAAYGALEPEREALTSTNGNAQRTSRPSSFIGSGGKSRFYGDLRASIGSIGGEQRVGKEADSDVVEIYNDNDDERNEYDRTRTMQSESDYSANFEVYASDSEDEGTVSALNVQHLRMQNGNQYAPPKNDGVNVAVHQASPVAATQNGNWNGVRQISNATGYESQGGYAGLGKEFGVMARRREVSGKVAEEGRSRMEMYEEVKEVREDKKKGLGASGMGWARFKGL